MPLTAGQSLSFYEILGPLGAGGMGEVYRARDTRLEREVAIKVLPEHFADDEERLRRFEREAKTLAALNHPNVAGIHGIDQVGDLCFLALELVPGEDLESRLARGPLAVGEALEVARQIAEGLEAAHAAGIVHRDLKPANVRLTPDGRVKLVDFGLAKSVTGQGEAPGGGASFATMDGTVLGTPPYMSPEQARGGEVGRATDVWAFGCVLFECLSGRRAFAGDSVVDVLAAIVGREPDWSELPQGTPPAALELLRRCLQKDVASRLGAIGEARAALACHPEPAPDPAAPRLAHVASTVRSPFVAREAERTRLVARLDEAARGGGGLVLLAGDPGVGKTRLAVEILEEGSRRGFLTLTGNAYEEAGAPFVTAVEVLEELVRRLDADELRRLLADDAPEIARLVPELRRRLPDLPAPMDLPPEQQRRFLFNGILALLERAGAAAPVVVLLDDLHWADDSTLLLLEHLAPHLARLRVLVVGTYRDVESEVGEAFARTVADLVRRRLAERIAVGPLTEAAVERLLVAVGGSPPPRGLVEGIFRATEGNAFFVEEVFRHLSERGLLFDEEGRWRADLAEHLDVPQGVLLVTGRRLDRLAEPTRRTLTAAAVQGPRFDLAVLEAMAGANGADDADDALGAVEEAEDARLVAPEAEGRGERYRFVHGLVRQVLLTRLSRPRLRRLHLGVADALERLGGERAEAHAAEIARHLVHAGATAAPARTLRYLTLAGEQALAASALDEAIGFFDDALAFEDELTEDARGELLYRRGVAWRGLGDWARSASDWEAALPHVEASGEATRIEELCSDLSLYYMFDGRLRDAAAVAERGLRALPEHAERERCHLLSAAGSSTGLAGDPGRGGAMLDEAQAMAERIGAPRVRALVLQRRMQFQHGHILTAEGVEAGFRSAELLRAADAPWQLSNCLSLLLMSLAWQGRLSEARELADEHEPLALRVGDLGAQTCIVLARLLDALARGGPAGAVELADRAVEVCRPLGFGMHALDYQAMVRFWAGSWEEARAISERAVAQERDDVWNGWETAHRILIGAYLGEPPAVEPERLPRAGEVNAVGRWGLLFALVEASAVVGELARAAELLPLVREALATGARYAWCFGYIEKVAGIAAAAGERWEEAEEHLARAERLALDAPHRLELAEVRRWRAWTLLRRDETGDRQNAARLLADAAATYGELGMPRHAALAARPREEPDPP